MALFSSQVLTQASGSVGGMTYSRNRGGMYIRARTVPTNPNTPAQQTVRAILADLTNLWANTLTQAQRDAWNVYASEVVMFNRLGEEIHLSGQQHYVRSNAPRELAGLTRVDAGPTTYNLGSFTPITATTASTSSVAINFTEADPWVSDDGSSLLVFLSRPLQYGTAYFRGPYRFADGIDGNSSMAPTTPATITAPFSLVDLQSVAGRVVLTQSDGRLSATQFFGPQQVSIA